MEQARANQLATDWARAHTDHLQEAQAAYAGLLPDDGDYAVAGIDDHQTENDTEARCGPLDPTRFDEEGNYIPLPGC